MLWGKHIHLQNSLSLGKEATVKRVCETQGERRRRGFDSPEQMTAHLFVNVLPPHDESYIAGEGGKHCGGRETGRGRTLKKNEKFCRISIETQNIIYIQAHLLLRPGLQRFHKDSYST